MSPEFKKWLAEYREFNRSRDSYTFKEKMMLLDDFQERLYELDNKPLEI